MSVLTVVFAVLMFLVAGATCYSCITLYAAIRFRKTTAPGSRGFTPPVSVIKPLCGMDRELASNLESFCRQNYPSYEILFSVREETDPAVPLVRRLQKTFPALPIRLLTLGQPVYLNAKVHGLEEMMRVARHEILVISDSDVRVGPDYLQTVVRPLADPAVGLVTCLSRGVPAKSVWSLLEALGMNTQFLAGILAAWLLIGMEFSLGPTMVIRKQQVNEIGGFGVLGDYLADDFVLGDLVAKAGYRVVLSGFIPEHLFAGEHRKASLAHRLRWERSSRCSRPWGYLGQIFMHPLPLVLMAWACAPLVNGYVLGVFGICLVARYAVAWQVGWRVLRDPALRPYWWLLPVQDLVSFGIWCWAFVGNKIVWRGALFRVLRGGKLKPVAAPVEDRVPVNVEE